MNRASLGPRISVLPRGGPIDLYLTAAFERLAREIAMRAEVMLPSD